MAIVRVFPALSLKVTNLEVTSCLLGKSLRGFPEKYNLLLVARLQIALYSSSDCFIICKSKSLDNVAGPLGPALLLMINLPAGAPVMFFTGPQLAM
jgi:hypothetical protein